MDKFQVTKHIRDLCINKNLDYMDLYNLICNAIDESGNIIDYPDPSLVNKWVNVKVQKPDQKYISYIAKALNVPEEEIILGKETDYTKAKKEIELYENLMRNNETQKENLVKIIWWGKYHLSVFSLYSLNIGVMLLNLSRWKNGLIFILNIFFALGIVRYDNRKYNKEKEISNKGTIMEKTIDDVNFIKFLFKKDIISHITLIIVSFIVVLSFIPFIEYFFYKGELYVSCSIFFVIAGILFIMSVFRKE